MVRRLQESICSFKPDEGGCGGLIVSISNPQLALSVEPPTHLVGSDQVVCRARLNIGTVLRVTATFARTCLYREQGSELQSHIRLYGYLLSDLSVQVLVLLFTHFTTSNSLAVHCFINRVRLSYYQVLIQLVRLALISFNAPPIPTTSTLMSGLVR